MWCVSLLSASKSSSPPSWSSSSRPSWSSSWLSSSCCWLGRYGLTAGRVGDSVVACGGFLHYYRLIIIIVIMGRWISSGFTPTWSWRRFNITLSPLQSRVLHVLQVFRPMECCTRWVTAYMMKVIAYLCRLASWYPGIHIHRLFVFVVIVIICKIILRTWSTNSLSCCCCCCRWWYIIIIIIIIITIIIPIIIMIIIRWVLCGWWSDLGVRGWWRQRRCLVEILWHF